MVLSNIGENMASNNWKKVEYLVAEKIGGMRVPVSGRSRTIKGDVEHPIYFIEVKSGKQVPKIVLKWYEEFKKSEMAKKHGFIMIFRYSVPKTILKWYEKTEKDCPEGKKPLLIIKPRYCHYEFVLWRVFNYFYFTTLDTFVEQVKK